MKTLLLLASLIIITACSSTTPPLISKKNCKNTCIMKGMEMKDYDEDKGCYCGSYED